MIKSSPSPLVEKATVSQDEVVDQTHLAKADGIARTNALATAPETTIASFAHLDEKKILRKMDMRLIPILALLYLLSFLDRMFR